jgi:peptidylprolyl isomerase
VSLRRQLAALAAAALLGFAGCSDDDDESASSGTTAADTETETAAETETQAEPDAEVNMDEKPEVTVPEGDPPAGLEIEDLKKGDGPTAKSGDTVTVHYVGVSYSTGEQFDASWDRQEPFTFPLGGGQVIPGWDQGVAGMKVGGRRRLTIPPDLGYGESGQPPAIAPNETLIFVVDLLEVG